MPLSNVLMSLSSYRVTFPGLGIDDGLEISRIAFRLGSIEIYWYGLLIALGVLLAMFLSVRHAPQFNLKSDDVLDFYLWTIPMGIIGARIYYIVFAWDEFSHNIWSVFDTRNGGLAFYGGIITGALTVYIVARIKKITFPQVAHFFIPYVPLGQAIGRWGNFFNQEAFGTNTNLPWGMYSNGTRNYLSSLADPALDPNSPVHPTFLYEFVGNLIIYFILIAIRKRTKDGFKPLAAYLVLYGTLRFFVERIRTDSLYIGNTDIRVSALLSAVMVIAGLAYWIFSRSDSKRSIRRQEMAALLSADPEASSQSDEVGMNLASDQNVLDENEASLDDAVEADEDLEDLPVEELDMDRLIREAREAAAKALASANDDGDAIDDVETPVDDSEDIKED